MNRDARKKWRHDLRNSLNGVVCMASLLEESELTDEQRDLVKYILSSADKAVELLDQDRANENPVQSLQEESNRDGDVLRILVAEDEDINRLYLTTLLKQQSWIIDEATDGHQAVELCRDKSYGIILLNVSLSGLDGFQVSRQIRENGITTPVIAITSYSLADLKERIQEAGVDEVLRKPFTEEQLIETVRKLIRQTGT